ncbi:hypothetical protein [Acidithiobacillus sp.]|uniref:hypothetical protein n=1 Tax=Acidithiobacillus sp. TaxID=1872118 RepID=UPI00356A0E46
MDRMQGVHLPADRSGLFLAAPRRTGKTSFLQKDLIPELRSRGILPIYVDLWADTKRDPGFLIAQHIQQAMQAHTPSIQKILHSMGLAEVSLFGALKIGLQNDKTTPVLTLPEALRVLVMAAQCSVTLIVDEAQHTLNTEVGLETMFALKSARDLLRYEPTPLYLVMTGSNRDKLGQLIYDKQQPFFGAEVAHFPLLDDQFLQAFTQSVNQYLTAEYHLQMTELQPVFRMVGSRPELLWRLVLGLMQSHQKTWSSKQLLAAAGQIQQQEWAEITRRFGDLTEVQRAVMETLLETKLAQNPESGVFSTAFLTRCGEKLGKKTIPGGSVQTALEKLRRENWIWRASWGGYLLEDDHLVDWYQRRLHDRGNEVPFPLAEG